MRLLASAMVLALFGLGSFWMWQEATGGEDTALEGVVFSDESSRVAVGPTAVDADPRPAFEAVAAARERLGLSTLSMGMSRDLEAAVECGPTMVRVGTALFGPRRVSPPPAK